MADIVDLKGRPVPTKDDLEFISDMARFSESILSEKAIRKKYRMFDDAVWQRLGTDDDLVRTIEAESVRRIRDGSAKREKAQKLVVAAPDVLGAIMNGGNDVSPRHRIDAIRTLDTFAANGPAGVPAADRFQIVINLGADLEGRPIVEKYDRSIAIDVNDIDPHHIEDTPHGPWPIITANRRKDDGSGEPL